MTFFLYFAMSITRRAHLLISANHRMERLSKNDPWVIINKIRSSSMTLSEGNRHSFRSVWLMKGIFTWNPSAVKDLLPFAFPWQGLFNPSAGFVIPRRGSISPITNFFFPQMGLIKLNLYPLRRRSQNCSMEILSAPSTLIFNFEAPFETFHSARLTHTSKAVAYWENTS